MKVWQKALQSDGGYAHLAAAGITLLFSLPIAIYLGYQQYRQSDEILLQASQYAAKHLHIIDETLGRAGAAARLLADALPGRSEEQLRGVADDLLKVVAADRIEVVRSGHPPFFVDRNHDATAVVVDGEAESLRPLGEPVISVRADHIVVSQSLTQAIGNSEHRFWGYASVVIPFADLVRAAGLDELGEEGYSVRLRHIQNGMTPGTVLFDDQQDARPMTAVRSLTLPGNGTLRLELRPRTVGIGALPTVTWISLAVGCILLYFLALRLLRRPAELEREVAHRTRLLDEEKLALQREIASRTHAEGLLERSHRLLDSIFEHIPGMIVLKRAGDLRIARVNRSCEELLGRSRDAIIGRCNEEIYPACLAGRLSQSDYQAMLDNQLVELPLERVEMHGQPERWVRFRKVALNDAAGRADYILEFGEDMTEREGLDLRLREHLNFLEQLIDAIPSPLFFKDARGRYIGVNKAFENFIGIGRAEIIGKTVFDVAPRKVAYTYHRADSELLAAGGSQIYESSAATADGGERHIMCHKAVFHATTGEVSGIVGILLDITERKAAEARISQLNRILTVLSETNQAIVRIHDRDHLLHTVTALIHDQGNFPVAWAYLDGENIPLILSGFGDSVELVRRLTAILQGATGDARTRPVYAEAHQCGDEQLAADLVKRGLNSFAHLPLTVNRALVGGIGIIDSAQEGFNSEERQMLADLADNLSFALEAFALEESRKAAEEKLQLSAQVFENSTEGITITDAANRILMVNKAFSAMTGYEPDEVIGKNPSILKSGRQGPDFYARLWESLKTHGAWRGEIENRRKNGEIYPEWLDLSVVRNAEGVITNYVAVFSDLTKRKEIEQRLNFLAHYDGLTSLPNRTLFHHHLGQAIAKARSKRSQLAVLVMDIDRFQLVNESIGHSAGDRLLLEVANRLTASAAANDCVCRLGGDEFAIILHDIQSPDDVANRTREIQQSLRRTIPLEGHEIHLSASIGISLFPADADTLENLLGNADSAMYSAIGDGGNTFRFFQQEMNSHSAERMRLEGRLHHALERGELAVHFQPLVSARNGRIIGAEALLRWYNKETETFVPPSTFVPLLEETGLIVPIGEWAMRTACEQNHRWCEATGSDLFVAVNLSAIQLADEKLLEKVRAILRDTEIDPGCLEIELTESAVMRDAERGIRRMHELKELGVSLSIDDFGTGYSSLSYLKQLPLDTLKIDRSFVTDAPTDPEAVSIIRAIVAMGHSLQFEIIAEGVENSEQVSFLQHTMVDILQGFRFSKALPAEAFLALLQESPAYALSDSSQNSTPVKPIPFKARPRRHGA